MKRKCVKCGVLTKNAKFCSRSCSVSVSNLVPKRKAKSCFCKKCNIQIKSRRTLCDDCNPFVVDWATKTLGDLQKNRKYQVNSRIRDLARRKTSNLPDFKKCLVCGYDRHIEVCHIKPISSYSADSLISDINSISNLLPLCPNHHWEFDNNFLSLDSPFLATYILKVSSKKPN